MSAPGHAAPSATSEIPHGKGVEGASHLHDSGGVETGSASTADPPVEAAVAEPTVVIVGAGLIGASLGLALRQAGRAVHLIDASPQIAAAAAAMGAGSLEEVPADTVGLVVVAVPPSALGCVVAEQLRCFPEATVTDVGSVKTPVLTELMTRGADISRYVGSHPMAGSHRSGPLGARADLFVDRTWVITPHDEENFARTAEVERLASLCGARVVLMPAADHDVAVAQVSHLPQLISSLVAGRLNTVPYQHLSLAGQGIRDVTRIAASDPDLWGQIVALNQNAIRGELERLASDLADLIDHLDNTTAVRRVIARGRQGLAGLPGKHGRRTTIWEPVVIEIPDQAGALADIFASVTQVGVNVEDISIEHDPSRQVGYLRLDVDGTEPAARLSAAMVKAGWRLRA